MARSLAFSVGLGVLFAWNWGRLESPRPSVWPLALMIGLGIIVALAPTRPRRAGAGLVALVVAGSVALDVAPWAVGRIAGLAGSGFLEFYDVLVPFNGTAHPNMRGVLLLAVFVFSLLGAFAVVSRRPVAASLVLVAGAGWPSTIDPGTDDLARGAVLLAAALALVAWLQPEGRRAPPQILVGAALVVLALIASSSTAVAKGQFLSWQNWDFYNKPGKPVNVAYIWRADYNGVRFPKNRTRVFTVQASPKSVYWRATTLDAFVNDHWDEDPIPLSLDSSSGIVGLWGGDALLPFAAANQSHWQGAAVTIDALHDRHLVGPTQPVQYVTRTISGVQYQRGGIAVASNPLSRGDQYSVWGYEPQPSPAALARSPAKYPPEIALDSEYLRLPHSNAVPTFRSPGYNTWAAYYFSANRDGRRYRPLYLAARRVAGKARNPYAAAVALEAWFRSAGGFVYDEQPPHTRGIPPLVDFVTKTKRGYCQHFAGAMALMLRYLGIPARVGAGFTSGTYNEKSKTWTVYDRDAHTWVEVWFKGYGWLPFDPTPSRGTLGGPYTTSSLSFDAPGAVKVLKASAMPGRQLLRAEFGSQSKAARAKAKAADPGLSGRAARSRGGSGHGTGIAALVLLAGLGLLLLFVVAKTVLRRSRYLTSDPRRVAAAARRDVVCFLLDQRIAVPRSIGPRELGTFLGTRAGIEAADFADALGRARFGPEADAAPAARQVRRELRAVRRRLRHVLPLGRRLRGLFSLRSLLTPA